MTQAEYDFLRVCRAHNTETTEEILGFVVKQIFTFARRLHRYDLIRGERSLTDEQVISEKRCEMWMYALLPHTGAKTVRIDGDPRGYPVKFIYEDGTNNHVWGDPSVGYGVGL